MSKYKHILYSTDLGQDTDHIAEQCSEIAKLYGAKLTLLHVIEPFPTYGFIDFVQMQEPAKAALSELGKRLGVPKENQLIEYGSVKGEVLAAADKLGVDLLIVGSHQRHGVMKLLGSNASAIAQSAPCDVSILKFTAHQND